MLVNWLFSLLNSTPLWNGSSTPNNLDFSKLKLSGIATNESQVKLTLDTPSFYDLQQKPQTIAQYKYESMSPRSQDVIQYLQSPLKTMHSSNFRTIEMLVPNITDKETVLNLAKIAANAYVPKPHEGDWSETDWDHDGFGWDDDRIRGYVFTTDDNNTMVISMKGTSTGVLDDGGPTGANDKINDNLLFSCCCARLGYMWSTVCDCFLGNDQCDERCVERSLYQNDRYYTQALMIYDQAKTMYPDAQNVWLVGHSLGGVLASLLGRTFGLPAVTFQAPGDQLAVSRLHLPQPPGVPVFEDYIYHFGHNADPIYMGTCKGSGSTCWLKGFAMESKCHSGSVCLYDTKGDLGWHESVVNHRIHVVIDGVLEKYDRVPECIPQFGCQDCENWEFIEDPRSLSLTDSESMHASSSKTSTMTTTPASDALPTHEASKYPTTSSEQVITSCVKHNWHWGCDLYTTYTTHT